MWNGVINPLALLEMAETSAKTAPDEDLVPIKDVPYREAIGSIMHLIMGTIAYISYAVGNLTTLRKPFDFSINESNGH